MGGDHTTQLLTPTDVRRLLEVHGLAPRRADGQNFVVDPNTVRKVVRDAGVGPDDHVLEFGAGLGSLTLALAETADTVTAVELDSGLVEVLRDLTADRDDVRVIHADALELDPARLLDEAGTRTARLVANLPYNTATPMVFHALAHDEVVDAFVMVQREVAERWRADVGDASYGAVSVKLGLVVDVRMELAIPRGVFHPVPNVDSSMVRLTRRSDAPSVQVWERLSALADTAFAQRRKTLRNTLRGVADPKRLEAAAAAAGIDLGSRAEALDGDDLRRLDAALRGGAR